MNEFSQAVSGSPHIPARDGSWRSSSLVLPLDWSRNSSRNLILPSCRVRYPADFGVRHQQLILDDLAQCHIDRSAVTRVRVAHQHKALETAGPGVDLHRLARHREARGPEPLAQLVGIDEGPVDQFARRVEDTRDGDFPTLAHRRQTSAAIRASADRIARSASGQPRSCARMYCVTQPTSAKPIVIVGSGMAGGNAAATLREEGYPGPVVLISTEPGVPFGRPPLSKTYLRSEEDLDGWYVRPPGWYADHGVELRNGPVVAAVDPAAHTVTLDSGEELGYHKILIATGGRNRRLKIPGADLPGIHYLRTVAECDAIKAEAVPGRRAVVVGMGFIGCEVAASLTQLGVQVTAVFPGQAPLETVLGGAGRRADRRHPPREGGRAAARGPGHRLRRGRTGRGLRHRRR